MVAVNGPDEVDWERELSSRRRASSLLDKLAGRGTTRDDESGVKACTKGVVSGSTGSAHGCCKFV